MIDNSSEETNEYSFMLAPSTVAGVGVFARHDIKKEMKLRLFSDEDSRFIPYNSPILNSPLAKSFCERYCVRNNDGYHCPRDFGQMEIGWYLNHSTAPNAYHRDYIYYALRDIKQGEEVLIDYGTL
jgi:SET domain-containing protein